MKFTVQYFDGCPNWKIADERVRQIATEFGGAEVTYDYVDTPELAEELRFRGSPSILIDGADPFAPDDAPVGLSCRVFQTPDGPAGSPTIEQLRAAVQEHLGVSTDPQVNRNETS